MLADVVYSHVKPMQKFGGIVPEIASREHLKALPLAVHEACQKAKVTLPEIDHLAVTNRPGLIGALLVGVSFTKGLAFALKKPFTTLHHLEAHLFSPLLAEWEGKGVPPFPWIALVVSGGHTELFQVDDILEYRWLGGTLDDAAGEAFDKIGKLLGFPYPAGPEIDRWVGQNAKDSDRNQYRFPRAKTPEFHFSFSGLKTAVANAINSGGKILNDQRLAIAASAQEAILDALEEKLEQARLKLSISTVVVTGGVACNSRFREKLPNAYFPKPQHCTDNAAMVALLADLHARKGTLVPSSWETTAVASAGLSYRIENSSKVFTGESTPPS